MGRKTNVVVIIADTLRAGHVGCYGNEAIHTPNMDALAARGVRFSRAFPKACRLFPSAARCTRGGARSPSATTSR